MIYVPSLLATRTLKKYKHKIFCALMSAAMILVQFNYRYKNIKTLCSSIAFACCPFGSRLHVRLVGIVSSGILGLFLTQFPAQLCNSPTVQFDVTSTHSPLRPQNSQWRCFPGRTSTPKIFSKPLHFLLGGFILGYSVYSVKRLRLYACICHSCFLCLGNCWGVFQVMLMLILVSLVETRL